MPGGQEVRVLEVPQMVPDSPAAVGRALTTRHWLIVSSVPERAYGEAALERGLQHLQWVGPRALAHEAVVEHFLSASAVLPMQLFTLFKADARAVEHVVRDRRRIARVLARIERHVEWGLRLTWNPPTKDDQMPAGRALSASATVGSLGDPTSQRRGQEPTSGAAYLARKRDRLELSRTRLKRARVDAGRLYRAVSREASTARRRTATEQAAPGSRLLLDAAFLVPTRRAGAFRAAVRRGARTLEGSGIVVSLTGPWPAYNFI